MAEDMAVFDFADKENDDDETTMGDLLKKLAKIEENTSVTATQAQKQMDETVIDKKEQAEAEQKARLTEDTVFADTSTDAEIADAGLYPAMDEHTKKVVAAIQALQNRLVELADRGGIPLAQSEDNVQEHEAHRRHTNGHNGGVNGGNGGNGGYIEGDEEEQELNPDREIEGAKKTSIKRIRNNEDTGKRDLTEGGKWEVRKDDEGFYERKRIGTGENGEWSRITKRGVNEKYMDRYKAAGVDDRVLYENAKDDEEAEQKEIDAVIQKSNYKAGRNPVDAGGTFHQNKGTELVSEHLNNAYNRIGRLRARVGRGMTEEEVANSGTMSFLGGLMGGIEKFAGPALDVAAIIGLAGMASKFGYDTLAKEHQQSISEGQAMGQNVQDAAYTVGEKLGFTMNSGADLQAYRRSALSENLMLYSKGADTIFDADKWLKDQGFSTSKGASSAVDQYTKKMALMGDSAEQVEEHFEKLSLASKKLGISFDNLAQTTTSEDTYAEEVGGNDKGVTKGTEEMDKLLNDWGLNASALGDIQNSKGGAADMVAVLQENGYGDLAESTGGNGEMLMNDIIREHLGGQLLTKMFGMNHAGFMNEFEHGSLAQKQSIATTMQAYFGIKASDWYTGTGTADKILTGQAATPQVTNATLTIKLSKGLQHEIEVDNGDDRASYNMKGSEGYFASHNMWVQIGH